LEFKNTMRDKRHLTSLLVILICAVLLAAPMALSAQDNGDNGAPDTAAEVAQSGPEEAATVIDDLPQGISTLILLLGIGGVLIVGGAMIARDNFKGEEESAA
jgi:hypothetical protein